MTRLGRTSKQDNVLSALLTHPGAMERIREVLRQQMGVSSTCVASTSDMYTSGRYLCEFCQDHMTEWSVPAAASPIGTEMAICPACVVALGYKEVTAEGESQRTFVPPTSSVS